ncbi:MAG: ATP-binding protein [Gammaproteobacteria bacterium]
MGGTGLGLGPWIAAAGRGSSSDRGYNRNRCHTALTGVKIGVEVARMGHVIDVNEALTAGSHENLFPQKALFRLTSSAIAAASWAYVLAIPFIFELNEQRSQPLEFLATWMAIPVQIVTLLLLGWLLLGRGLASHSQITRWRVVLTFTLLSLVATYVWNTYRPNLVREVLSVADGVYLFGYWVLAAAFAVLFLQAGGSFKRVRVWLDGATMMAVQLVALWSFFLAPSFVQGLGHKISLSATFSYSITLAATLTMAALLCLQLPNYRRHVDVLLLVVGGVAAIAWESVWLVSWLVDSEFIGSYYNYGDVLCFTCMSTAVSIAQYQTPVLAAANPERRIESFLPALAVLMTIALVAGTLATTQRTEAWILVGLVGLCALLLITRQHGIREELRDLTRQVVSREAEARLTELVRRSVDLIVVVNERRMVSFASPAAQSLLSTPAERLLATPAVRLFGWFYEELLTRLLDCVMRDAAGTEVLELHVDRPPEKIRVFKIVAANQLTNPLINGIVLTIQDVTGQHILEREVLDVAMRERVRLCADIHDGLGQDLAGIAMLLHAAAKSPDPGSERQRQQLEAIVGHVNDTISAARDLARGLSPLHVVQGSLSGAVHRLAQDSCKQIPIRLFIDPEFDDRVSDGISADHLYRIAQEALSNALRHSGCANIDIELGVVGKNIVLSVADDGKGINTRSSDDTGLGLRLMEYRARMMGGTLNMGVKSGAGGTRLEVIVPGQTRRANLMAAMHEGLNRGPPPRR